MEQVENQKSAAKKVDFHHVAQTFGTAIVGFILSVFLILIALIILVRFWVFAHILYNLFVLCYLVVGVIFNIASVNLTLNEYPESLYLMPFVAGLPVSLFWTLLCIVFPFFKHDFFSQFSQLPIALYDNSFYSSSDAIETDKSIHPFAVKFAYENSIFEKKSSLIIFLIVFAVAQAIFWINTIAFYYKLKRDEVKLSKIEIEEPKEL